MKTLAVVATSALSVVLIGAPAVAGPFPVDVWVKAPAREVGQAVIVKYDVQDDVAPGDVKVVVRRVGGGYRDVFRDPSYPIDGRIRIVMDRARNAGRYSVVVKWSSFDGSQAASTGKVFRVTR